MPEKLNEQEKKQLLIIARKAISAAVNREPVQSIPFDSLSPNLSERGASFVTLKLNGNLRGCIGTLEAYQPLAQDVQEHAIAAALQDFRFPPVKSHELVHIEIEISHLTVPDKLEYNQPDELLTRLRPGIDGVILDDGYRKATFLPQVWEQLPDPAEFLSHLCMKMGASQNFWRNQILNVMTYQVEEFHE